MNLVILNDAAHITGGAGKVAIDTACSLSRKGINVILFTAVGPVDKSLEQYNLKVICLFQNDILNDSHRLRAIVQGLYNIRAKREFKRILKQLSPESTIIHFHSWTKSLSSSLFSVTAKFNYKVVITLHEYFSFCPNGSFYNYKQANICQLIPLSCSCISCNCDSRHFAHKVWRVLRQYIQNNVLWDNRFLSFITISTLNRRILENNTSDKKIRIYNLRNPIEINTNTPVNPQENCEYFFIGRLSSEKGVELFCKVITELGLKGVVLGDGYLLNDLKAKYSNISFEGWIKHADMYKYMKRCRALIFPSLWYEGSPLTIIEIKSYGIPCIVPDKCAASEEIIDEETGFIFESGNVKSLKSAIVKMNNIDITKMSKEILRQFNPALYSMDTHISNLLNIYNDIL
jgi:glycosyltransferase involved in cell wall biosynthesis